MLSNLCFAHSSIYGSNSHYNITYRSWFTTQFEFRRRLAYRCHVFHFLLLESSMKHDIETIQNRKSDR